MLPTDTNLIVVKALEGRRAPTSLSLHNTRVYGTNPHARLTGGICVMFAGPSVWLLSSRVSGSHFADESP